MSGSAPTSGSQLPGGITSLLAPSCAPASRIWDTSSSSTGTSWSPPSPVASAPTPSRKSRAWAATRSASGCQPSPDPASCDPGTGALHIKQPPSFERAPEGHLVRVLQVPPDRKPTRRPGHPQPQRLDQPGQIGRGRLSLQVGVGGEDQLGDAAVGQPRHQLPGPQILRADPVDGADRTTQDMVTAAEFADFLNRSHVLRLLDHADHREVTAGIPADPALLLLGHVAAYPAEPHPLGDLDQHRGQAAHVGRVGAQQVEGDALGALGPDAGQPAELVDEALDHSFVHVRSSPPGDRRAAWVDHLLVPSGSSPPMAPPAAAPPGAAPPGAASPPKNSLSPGTSPGPPGPPSAASGPIFSCCSSPAARQASRTAASTRSATDWAVSAGSVTSIAAALIVRSTSSPWPLTVAVTSPPPAVPSTSVSASSCWALMSWCCICCAAASSCCMSIWPLWSNVGPLGWVSHCRAGTAGRSGLPCPPAVQRGCLSLRAYGLAIPGSASAPARRAGGSRGTDSSCPAGLPPRPPAASCPRSPGS